MTCLLCTVTPKPVSFKAFRTGCALSSFKVAQTPALCLSHTHTDTHTLNTQTHTLSGGSSVVTYLAGCLCVAESLLIGSGSSRHVRISSFETASLFLFSTAQPPLPSSYSCLSSFSLSKRLFALSLSFTLSPCECALFSLSLACLISPTLLPLCLFPFLTHTHTPSCVYNSQSLSLLCDTRWHLITFSFPCLICSASLSLALSGSI